MGQKEAWVCTAFAPKTGRTKTQYPDVCIGIERAVCHEFSECRGLADPMWNAQPKLLLDRLIEALKAADAASLLFTQRQLTK